MKQLYDETNLVMTIVCNEKIMIKNIVIIKLNDNNKKCNQKQLWYQYYLRVVIKIENSKSDQTKKNSKCYKTEKLLRLNSTLKL